MFKLFKDLTRAPEPLNRSATSNNANLHPPHQSYVPRQRNKSPGSGLATTSVSSESVDVRTTLKAQSDDSKAVRVEEKETNQDAIKVVELIKILEDAIRAGTSIMTYVDVSSWYLAFTT